MPNRSRKIQLNTQDINPCRVIFYKATINMSEANKIAKYLIDCL